MNANVERILITGSTGFIGKHLIETLSKDGQAIAVLSRKTGVHAQGIAEFKTDGSYASIEKAIQAFKPTKVIHLATLYLAQHRPEDLDALTEGNFSFGLKLLEAMSRNGVTDLINTGTMFQHFENEPYSPINLYAAMKQSFEDLVRHYVGSCGMKAIHLKISDSYGSNDTRVKVYGFLKRATETGERVEFSPGEQLVDPVHVDDVVRAYQIAIAQFKTLTAKEAEASFRISSGAPVSLKTLASLFETASGKKLNIAWGAKPYRDREVRKPYARFEWLPGWKPEISLKQGIERLLGGR